MSYIAPTRFHFFLINALGKLVICFPILVRYTSKVSEWHANVIASLIKLVDYRLVLAAISSGALIGSLKCNLVRLDEKLKKIRPIINPPDVSPL